MDKKEKIKIIIVLSLIALTLGFIWINSCIPSKESVEESGKIYTLIVNIVKGIFGEDASVLFSGWFTPIVFRKVIHFCEFALLGVEFFFLYLFIGRYRYGVIPELISIGFAVGLIDESIQILSNRGAAVQDVLLDGLGFAVAVGVAVLIKFLMDNKKSSKIEKKEE